MAGKNPAFLFFPNDWEKDLGHHPHEIGGAWMLILCKLHWYDGDLTLTWTEWSKVLRVSLKKTKRIISFLNEKCVADVFPKPGQKGGVRIVSRRMVRDAKKREEERLRKQREREDAENVPDLSGACPDSVREMSGRIPIPVPIPVPSPVTPPDSSSIPSSKKKPYTGVTTPPLGVRIMDSWNQNMPSKIRSVGKGRMMAINRNIKLDPEWEEKYHEAAVLFPEVNDKAWPGGRFTFDFTLQMKNKQGEFSPVVDRVLNGVYRKKSITGNPKMDANIQTAMRWAKGENRETTGQG